jgi:hypothetical protein
MRDSCLRLNGIAVSSEAFLSEATLDTAKVTQRRAQCQDTRRSIVVGQRAFGAPAL